MGWGEVLASQPLWMLPTLLNTFHLISIEVVGVSVVDGWVGVTMVLNSYLRLNELGSIPSQNISNWLCS